MSEQHEESRGDGRGASGVLARLAAVVADYAWAVARHARALLAPRPPARYREGDLTLPAVVLLPGVYETWHFLAPIAEALHRRGHRVLAVGGLGLNRRGIAWTADALLRALARRRPGAGYVLVGHSKGGLIGKAALLDDRAEALGVLGLVTVATPFGGARRARYFVDPTIRALLPGDATIRRLVAETRSDARIVSVFGDFDLHIPDGSALRGAANVPVPVSGHFRVLARPETIAAVAEGVAGLVAAAAGPAAPAGSSEPAA